MFERMTDAARRVIVDAQAEVLAMGHAAVGDDHLLLALAMGNDMAAELVARRVAVAALHIHVAKAHPVVQREGGHIPLTAEAKGVLQHSLRQALRLGCEEVDTMALLLAMFDVRGDAIQALTALDVDVDEFGREAKRAAEATRPASPGEEPIEAFAGGSFTAQIGTAEPSRSVRPWPSPRCQGCRRLIRDHVQLRTLDVPDQATGEVEQFRFLYCGACGTAFAIERIDR